MLGDDALVDPLLVLRSGLADCDLRHNFEVGRGERLDRLLPILAGQVRLQLRDDEVTLGELRHGPHHPLRAAVIDALHAVAKERPIPGGARPGSWLGAPRLRPQAALAAPIHELPVAELLEARVLLEEAVDVIEEALLWEAHGHHDGVLLAGGRPDDARRLHIGGGCVAEHPAAEGQALQEHAITAQVRRHSAVLESHGGEKRLPKQVLWHRLRCAHAHAVEEYGHGVRVGRRRVEVEQHAHHLLSQRHPARLADRPPTLRGRRGKQGAILVEADVVNRSIPHEQGASAEREADAEHGLGPVHGLLL
mmetsp:Transcript_7798/g.22261  ORF Transcript_7798/g.22261 Transcript_7798/m.22261 type:complete len:307 (+) Transcript_7798:1700-2620(+)